MEMSHGKIVQIAFGIFLILGMSWNLCITFRDNYIGYVSGGIDRTERPAMFWLCVTIFSLLGVAGLDFAVSGLAGMKPFIERLLFP